MMTRAVLVHWSLLRVVSASLVQRPSIICCLDALCVILCRESGRAVLLSGSWRGWEYSFWRRGPCCDMSFWHKKSWAWKTRQIKGFIFLVVRENSSTLCWMASFRIHRLHVLWYLTFKGKHICNTSISNVFLSFLHKNNNGFCAGECFSPSEAMWEFKEII